MAKQERCGSDSISNVIFFQFRPLTSAAAERPCAQTQLGCYRRAAATFMVTGGKLLNISSKFPVGACRMSYSKANTCSMYIPDVPDMNILFWKAGGRCYLVSHPCLNTCVFDQSLIYACFESMKNLSHGVVLRKFAWGRVFCHHM